MSQYTQLIRFGEYTQHQKDNFINFISCLDVGPKKEYCVLESDREFTNNLLQKIGVPKPQWKSFDDPEKAKDYVKKINYQVVVKANGLADGKGAIVCDNVDGALNAIDLIMIKKEFGEAGNKVVIEERKYGTEISFFVFMDGKHALPMKMFVYLVKFPFLCSSLPYPI